MLPLIKTLLMYQMPCLHKVYTNLLWTPKERVLCRIRTMTFRSTQLLLTATLLRMTTGDLTENRQKLTYLQLSLAETSPYS